MHIEAKLLEEAYDVVCSLLASNVACAVEIPVSKKDAVAPWKRLFLLPPQKLNRNMNSLIYSSYLSFRSPYILLIQVFELGPDRFNRVCVFL